MPDSNWTGQMRAEVLRAASRLNTRGARRRARRKFAAIAFAVLLLPGVALAATQPWDSSPDEPADRSGLVAEFDEPLDDRTGQNSGSAQGESETGRSEERPCTPAAATVSGAAPSSLTAELSVLKRSAADPGERNAYRFRAGTVYADHQTVVKTDDGRSYAVAAVKAGGTGTCGGAAGREPQICVGGLDSENGTELCAPLGRVRNGEAFAFSDHEPGARSGQTNVVGIVPDGVKMVRITPHPQSNTAVPMSAEAKDNIVSFSYNGSAAVPPKIVFVE